MSDALNYLKEVRPEVAEAYFTFLKKSGEHLDDKTRFLISIITKVDNQTEAGFRQYLSRALKEGNSANEIIDALLVAFPTLGLTKILWAFEQIQSMNLPEFDPANLNAQACWHPICKISDLNPGLNQFVIDGVDIFVYSSDSNIKVYDTHCPHQRTQIKLQHQHDDCLVCPKHQWKFDLISGECIENGNGSLREYQSAINNNELSGYW